MQLCTNICLPVQKILKNFVSEKKQYTIPIFIPHLGCPNDCVFCNQKKISGMINVPTREQVIQEIEQKLSELKPGRKVQIAFFGGSFTGISIGDQISYLTAANMFIASNQVESIRISTRPDYITDQILKMLKEYHVTSIELGVQSMDDEVLLASQRGHTKNHVIEAAKLIYKYGFELGFQLMVGLPKSTKQKEISTIKQLLTLSPKQLRIYPVYVLQDSLLYEWYKEKRYKPLSFKQAVNRCTAVVKACKLSKVHIIRLGLQSTQEISSNNKNIAGPVCDNFSEYVMAELIKEKVENRIKKEIIKGKLNIVVPKKYFSVVIGPKKCNKQYFEQTYHLDFKVKEETSEKSSICM